MPVLPLITAPTARTDPSAAPKRGQPFRCTVLGYPRIGPNRELKKSLEAFWAGSQPERYRAGTWGPAGSDAMLRRDGRAWRRP